MMIWWKWFRDWLKVAVFTLNLFSLERTNWPSFLYYSTKFNRAPYHVHHLRCHRRTICNNLSRNVMCTLLICLYSWFSSLKTEYQPYFVQLLHSYYSRACTLQQSGNIPLLCDWMVQQQKYVRDVKMPKKRLSSQRLIRRNPNLAFYFNWNPIFVISTNLLMVR